MLELTVRHKLYLVLVAVFLTSLLVADTTAGKFFAIGGLSVSVGVIPFPITFLLTDVVNEYYGTRGARLLTLIGMAMLVFAFVLITAARLLPIAPRSPVSEAAFQNVFGLSFRFFAASLSAYLLGQLADIAIFHRFKRMTHSRHIWLRATGSTAVSQIVDTVAVNFGALVGAMTLSEIGVVTFWSYVYKMIVAVALTPLLYVVHALLSRRLGIEAHPVEDDEPAAEAPSVPAE